MQAILGLLARGALQFIAGGLVAKGVVDASAASSFVEVAMPVVTGSAMALAAYAWSFVQKKKSGALSPQ